VTTYEVRQNLPLIPVTMYAGQAVTLTIPVLGASGTGVDVAGLELGRAQIRNVYRDVLVNHEWNTDTDPDGAELTGTLGGTDAALVLRATGTETALWQATWPDLVAVWDAEVIDSIGEPHRLCAVSTWTLEPEVTRVDGG
jgi:hypothetical protein